MSRKTFPFGVPYSVPLYLAPMAGVSESPFRRLCHAHGADVVVTEFLSAEGIRRENEATISKLRFSPDEHPIGVQIFGADPAAMADAAALVTDLFMPDFVDINFGCPVKKVVRRNGGSGCLRDLDLVQEIIRAVSKATPLPVTCKIRSGWSEEMRDPVGIALRCQDAGARVLALHARTRTQMYTGQANWDEIAKVAEALDIPVLGNGDIKTAADAKRRRKRRRKAPEMTSHVSLHAAVPRAYARSGGRALSALWKAIAMPLPVKGGIMAHVSPRHIRPGSGAMTRRSKLTAATAQNESATSSLVARRAARLVRPAAWR